VAEGMGMIIMNMYKAVEWVKNESERKYGEHVAFTKCHKYLLDNMMADIAETKCIIDTEPSDAERSKWTEITKRYVESLEIIVDGVLDKK
jgi:hypothetical protein